MTQNANVLSNRTIRNSAMNYMVYVNLNSTKGAKMGIVGLRPNDDGFEGAVAKDGQYSMEYFNSLYKENALPDANGYMPFAYEPLNTPENYGFTGVAIYAARLALCMHYRKMTEGKDHSKLVQVYTPASVALKLWRAQSFVNGKVDTLLTDKQMEAYDEKDAKGLAEELGAFAQTLQAINQAGVTVGIKNYEELEFTVIKDNEKIENFSRFKGETATFAKGKAILSDGTQIEADYSINGARELAVRKNPFGNNTILVALKNPMYSKELLAGIGMKRMLQMIMPTKQNCVAEFAREMLNRRAQSHEQSEEEVSA